VTSKVGIKDKKDRTLLGSVFFVIPSLLENQSDLPMAGRRRSLDQAFIFSLHTEEKCCNQFLPVSLLL